MRPLHVTLLCALALVAAAPAHAHMPKAGAKFVTHAHDVPGDGWHIELTVAGDSKRVSQLVLHSERCAATVVTSNLAIRADGTIDSTKPFRRGTWTLQARFTDRLHVEGSFRITTPSCDGGPREFSAHAEDHGHGHDGQGHHGHGHLYGTPPGTYPELGRATPAQRAQVRRLWRRSRRAARTRFPTYRAARALDFLRRRRPLRRPVIFHLRHAGYERDGRVFDARRPESLVYWWPANAKPVLVAYMYRYPPGRRPALGGPLLGWHRHGGPGTSPMTHVWMTGDLRTALANCLPVAALEAADPAFRWARPGQGSSVESRPCP